MMATIRDVATHAGVSTATVSHVLNDTRFVSPETRQLVLNAVDALGYRPSAVARSLSTNTTNTVGIVVADVTSPFFAFLLQEIESLLDKEHYNLFICNTYEDPEVEARHLERLYEQRVDGVILTATGFYQPVFEQFHAHQTPLIFIDRLPPNTKGSFVGTDHIAAAYDATSYLAELGHRRIALVTLKPETSTVTDRLEGYRSAYRDQGLPLDENLLVTTAMDIDEARRETLRLLDLPDRPTALIAGSHITTLGALHALSERNLHYPDDLSLLCFDNSRWTPLLTPPLTVMYKPITQLANKAVSILLDQITSYTKRTSHEDDMTEQPQPMHLYQTELVLRGSCRRIEVEELVGRSD